MTLFGSMPAPDETTLLLAAVGIVSLFLGVLSWKIGQRKKARLAKNTEELK